MVSCWERSFHGSVVSVRVMQGDLYFTDEGQPCRQVPFILDMPHNILSIANGDGSHTLERAGDALVACERAYAAASRERAALAPVIGKVSSVIVGLLPLLAW